MQTITSRRHAPPSLSPRQYDQQVPACRPSNPEEEYVLPEEEYVLPAVFVERPEMDATLPDLEAPVAYLEMNATEAARQIKDKEHERVQTKAKAAEAEVEANATKAQSGQRSGLTPRSVSATCSPRTTSKRASDIRPCHMRLRVGN